MRTLTGIMSQKSQIEYLESGRARAPSRNRAGRSAMIDAVSEHPCGKLLKPTIPLWIESCEKHHGELCAATRAKVEQCSARQLDGITAPHKLSLGGRRGRSSGRTRHRLKRAIAVRCGPWEVDRLVGSRHRVARRRQQQRRIHVEPHAHRHPHRLDRTGRFVGQQRSRSLRGLAPDRSANPLCNAWV